VRLAEEGREPVKPLDHRVPTPKPAAQRGEGDAVLGIDGIDGGVNPDNVQEPRDFADHRPADSRGVMGPAFIKNLRVDSESRGRPSHITTPMAATQVPRPFHYPGWVYEVRPRPTSRAARSPGSR